ncbi:MAG TPA: branched-chain amino acid ABC transporter permease [Pseudolabrys sp.]|nr:branched-chain amino acid ABC transporter permease [Pseudolabrys sp.]
MELYLVSLATIAALNIMLAVGLNLISGFCGQISLGHAAFYGLGAYAAALAAVAGMPFTVNLAIGVAVAALIGFFVGFISLRVREDFLAIATMGVGFLFLGFVRKQDWLGAEMGISRIPAPPLDRTDFALLCVALAACIIAVSLHIGRSWMGLSLNAVAQDETAARTIGINVPRFKLAAFTIGTAMAGLAGGLYAYMTQLIVPDAFNFVQSITILAMVVIGGIGSTWGAVIGAVILTLMPEVFRFINDYKLLVYGALLLIVMRFAPAGIAGIAGAIVSRVRR